MERAESDTIEGALKLLDAAAAQKKDELLGVMSDKYAHLKSLLIEKEGGLGKSFAGAKVRAVEAALRAKEVGVEKARALARDMDKKVRDKPWAYIAGAATVSLLLGYILGRNRS